MANRDKFLVGSIQPEMRLIAGNFVIDGGSAVGAIKPGVSLLTVGKPAGTGIYRVTLVDVWSDVLHADFTILKAAGTLDMKVDANSYVPASRTIDLQVKKSSDGTALDPTSITISYLIVVLNSGVTV